MIRSLLILGTALALAGCETSSADFAGSGHTPVAGGAFSQSERTALGNNGVAITNSQIDPSTGQRVVTGGSFVIGSGHATVANAMLGRWTLGDDYARRCSLSLNATPLTGSSGAMQAERSGFCSSEFSGISGWMVAGSGIALTDASGRIQGQLVADNAGGYAGTFNSTFGPSTVRLSRGGF
ncbi:MAG: hypothetical protein ABS75_20935 [Pelagibacterium sp. SCN 63-23]|nr:MAG: hypothetical protein ABS75_20935 [Pelagibacterium sp. SCN 63-23]